MDIHDALMKDAPPLFKQQWNQMLTHHRQHYTDKIFIRGERVMMWLINEYCAMDEATKEKIRDDNWYNLKMKGQDIENFTRIFEKMVDEHAAYRCSEQAIDNKYKDAVKDHTAIAPYLKPPITCGKGHEPIPRERLQTLWGIWKQNQTRQKISEEQQSKLMHNYNKTK